MHDDSCGPTREVSIRTPYRDMKFADYLATHKGRRWSLFAIETNQQLYPFSPETELSTDEARQILAVAKPNSDDKPDDNTSPSL